MFWYLASPYSRFPEGLDAAHTHACAVAAILLERGVSVYSPIAHSHHIGRLVNAGSVNHDFWLRVCRPMADSAAGLLVLGLDGWRDSVGVTEEIRWFVEANRTAILVNPEGWRYQWLYPQALGMGAGLEPLVSHLREYAPLPGRDGRMEGEPSHVGV